MNDDLRNKIDSLPQTPGVYIMRNRQGEIIYVGKAVSLKKRVKSYFQGRGGFAPKIMALISNIAAIDYIQTTNEKEALLLEYEIIKRYRPRYNVEYRDDKSYPFIKLTTNELWPRLIITRQERKDKARYYGPYPDGSHLRKTVGFLRKYFSLRQCKQKDLPKKLCFYYHIKRCWAPCIGLIDRKKYQQIVEEVDLFLKNKYELLINILYKKLKSYVKRLDFEQAQRLKLEIEKIENFTIRINIRAIKKEILLKGDFRAVISPEILRHLQELFNLATFPEIIEAFDISNISGQEAVGSVVVFRKGQPDKNQYRRFCIKTIRGIDDYAMMAEIVRRRYERQLRENKSLPDLVLIDGGKGHLLAVKKVLGKLGLSNIPVASIAKKLEKIFFVQRSSVPIVLDRRSPLLHLLQHIRDEAHRFALRYHKLLRKKTISKQV